jgi:hypothetical protein
MYGRVATGCPAGPHLQEAGIADVDLPTETGRGHLRVTAQAKVWITLREHFTVQRAVRVVARRAAFPQGRMLEDDRPRLLAMALRATLAPAAHGQPARRFEDVVAVRIMALHAIHPAFEDRMMVQRLKFAPRFQMALETGGRIFAGVDDEFGAATRLDVLAARSMTRFAACIAVLPQSGQMNTGMRTGREALDNGRVTIQASFVADFMGTRNNRRRINRPIRRGTRIHQQAKGPGGQGQSGHRKPTQVLRFGQAHESSIAAATCFKNETDGPSSCSLDHELWKK